MSENGTKRRLRPAGRLLAFVISCALFVLLFELALRVTGIQPDFFYRLDPEVGSTYIPGKSGWHVFHSEGRRRQWIEINSYGYRDREWESPKRPDTYRIALLGDSYVAAMEVPAAKRMGERLEARLAEECPGPLRFEVLNMGMTGYGTAEELLTLKHRALELESDLVLLFFYSGNDLFNNSRELDAEPNSPHYDLDESGELIALPFTVRDNPVKSWLRAHSRTFLFARERVKRLQAMRRVLASVGAVQESRPPGYVARQHDLEELKKAPYRNEVHPLIEHSWRITEALIGEAKRVASEADVDFGLVVVPTQPEVVAAPPAPSDSPWDSQKTLRRMDEICDRKALQCLQLAEALRRSAVPAQKLFWVDEGHWTEIGHEVVGDALFDWLRAPLCGDDRTAVSTGTG